MQKTYYQQNQKHPHEHQSKLQGVISTPIQFNQFQMPFQFFNKKCKFDHQVSLLCVSDKCKSPILVCSKCEENLHDECFVMEIKKLQNIFAINLQLRKEIGRLITDSYSRIINHIYKAQQQYCKNLMYFGYQQQTKVLLKQLFFSSQPQSSTNIQGKHIKQLKQDLFEIKNSHYYRKQAVSERLQFLQMQILQKIDYDLQTIYNCADFIDEFDSKIIQKEDDISFIKDSFFNYTEKQLQKLNLIYRASENDFSAAKFHQACDNHLKTFVIIKTQYQNIICGYNPQKWRNQFLPKTNEKQSPFHTKNEKQSNKSNSKINENIFNQSCQAFLLQINKKKRIHLFNNNKIAVKSIQNYGPIFGNNDICIVDRCNINQSKSLFPRSYAYEDDQANIKQTQGHTLTGGLNNTFKVIEYEVFGVYFDY